MYLVIALMIILTFSVRTKTPRTKLRLRLCKQHNLNYPFYLYYLLKPTSNTKLNIRFEVMLFIKTSFIWHLRI